MITLCGFGVSNYYNKLKLVLLEKAVPFRERLVYPWQRDSFLRSSPLGKIPFLETERGSLSESQVILDYLEESHQEIPLYPADAFGRAKCRELIQHIELNVEWVARRLYKEAFFGGSVSDETKRESRERLAMGLASVGRLASFCPYVAGSSFTAADCVTYMHVVMVKHATLEVFGEDMAARHVPQLAAYMRHMDTRPHVQSVMADRERAMVAFAGLGVAYDG